MVTSLVVQKAPPAAEPPIYILLTITNKHERNLSASCFKWVGRSSLIYANINGCMSYGLWPLYSINKSPAYNQRLPTVKFSIQVTQQQTKDARSTPRHCVIRMIKYQL